MREQIGASQKMVVLMGPSGSGKSTITQQALATFSPHLARVKNITSREKRKSEEIESDYIHLTKEACRDILTHSEDKDIVEWTKIGGHYYILPRPDAPFGIVSLTPSGVAEAQQWAQKQKNMDIITLGVRSQKNTCEKRMQARGDSPQAIAKRLEQDSHMFSESAYRLCNFTVSNEGAIEDAIQRVQFIIASLLDL